MIVIERTCKSKEEAQALANFLWSEGMRHGDDIKQIVKDLRDLESKWNVKPSRMREFVKP